MNRISNILLGGVNVYFALAFTTPEFIEAANWGAAVVCIAIAIAPFEREESKR